MEDIEYPVVQREMPPGSRLAIITDGLYEVEDPDGTMLDVDGLIELMKDFLPTKGDQFLESMVNEVYSYSGGSIPSDDRSVVIIDSLRPNNEPEH